MNVSYQDVNTNGEGEEIRNLKPVLNVSGTTGRKRMKKLIDIDMEVIRNNEPILINIEGIVHYVKDNYYGADADGNRGESTIEVTDVKNIFPEETIDNISLSKEEEDQASDLLVRKFLESY